MAGSDAFCLAGVGVGAVVALVLTICKMVRYHFVSPRYQLDPNNSTKERKNGTFLKSYSLSMKTKGVPLPFLKTLLDSFLCDETNEPNALIPSLSQPKTSRE